MAARVERVVGEWGDDGGAAVEVGRNNGTAILYPGALGVEGGTVVVGSRYGDRSYSEYVNGSQVGGPVSEAGVAHVRREGGGGGAAVGADVATLGRAGADGARGLGML